MAFDAASEVAHESTPGGRDAFDALLVALAAQLRGAEETLERLQAAHARELSHRGAADGLASAAGAAQLSRRSALGRQAAAAPPASRPSSGEKPHAAADAHWREGAPHARFAGPPSEADAEGPSASQGLRLQPQPRQRLRSVWAGRQVPAQLVAPLAAAGAVGPHRDDVGGEEHHVYPLCDVRVPNASSGPARLVLSAAGAPAERLAVGVRWRDTDEESLASIASSSSASLHEGDPEASAQLLAKEAPSEDSGSDRGLPDLDLQGAWAGLAAGDEPLDPEEREEARQTEALLAQFAAASGVVRRTTAVRGHTSEVWSWSLGGGGQASAGTVADRRSSRLQAQSLVRGAVSTFGALTGLNAGGRESGSATMELHNAWGKQQEQPAGRRPSSKQASARRRSLGSRRITIAGLAPAFVAGGGSAREAHLREGGGGRFQRLVLAPSSPLSLIWSSLELFFLLYDLLTIPMILSNLKPPENVVTTAEKYASMAFWNLDLLATFFRGYVTKDGLVEMRLKRVALKYVKGRFLYDLLLVLIEWANFLVNTFEFANTGRMIRFVRISRLLKMSKIQRSVENLLSCVRSNVALTLFSMTQAVVLILLTTHLIACGWYWVSSGSERDSVGAVLESYTSALHWSLAQLGFGNTDVFPKTSAEVAFSTAVAIVAVVSMAFLVGSVVTGLLRLQFLTRAQHEKEDQLRDYLSSRNVTWALRSRIRNFLRSSRIAQQRHVLEQSVELLKMLPKAMALELRAEVLIPVLLVHPFFAMYAVSQVDKVAMHHLIQRRAVQELALLPEHELFGPGEPATHMYFLARASLLYRVSARPGGRGGARSLRALGSQYSEFGSSTAALGPGDWLCEPPLWIRWCHVGSAVAKTASEMLGLDASALQGIMQQHLPEAQKYAAQFLHYAQDKAERLDDVYCDLVCLRNMAQDVFEAPSWFDLERCKPRVTTTTAAAPGWPLAAAGGGWGPLGGEWQPANRRQWLRLWASAWSPGHTRNRTTLLATMTADLKHDVVLVYQTLFPQSHNDGFPCPWLSAQERRLFDHRVLFLKRLLLCYATCNLSFTTERNGARAEPWSFPLASAFCHGGRVLLRLWGVRWQEFVTFLLFGDEGHDASWNWGEKGAPPPLYSRHAASHAVRMDQRTSELYEVKVKNFSALGSCHFGMDIPLGGLGNPAPAHRAGQLYIGQAGVPFQKVLRHEPHYLREIQHGHVYLRGDDFGTPRQASAAPGDQNSREATMISDLSFPVSAMWSNAAQKASPSGSASPKSAGKLRGSQWRPLRPHRTVGDLREALCEAGYLPAGSSLDAGLRRLHELAALEDQLQVEIDQNGAMRLKGTLLLLAVVADRGEACDTLVHRSASSLRPRPPGQQGKEPGGPDTVSVEDSRVLAAVCRSKEPLNDAVLRLCRGTLALDDAATERLLDACDPDEAFTFRCGALPTVCHHHEAALRQASLHGRLPLEYEALRLRLTVREQDLQLLGGAISEARFSTSEPRELHGFGGDAGAGGLPCGVGVVTHEWEWLSPEAAEELGVVGFVRPEAWLPLSLAKERARVSSILVGIESSAPLKEDLFGHKHTPEAKSKEMSAFGKRKWRDYGKCGQEVPADLGGMRCTVSDVAFGRLRELCGALQLSRPSEASLSVGDEALDAERRLFQELLQSGVEDADRILEVHQRSQRAEAANSQGLRL